jgi:hypothetical protein
MGLTAAAGAGAQPVLKIIGKSVGGDFVTTLEKSMQVLDDAAARTCDADMLIGLEVKEAEAARFVHG